MHATNLALRLLLELMALSGIAILAWNLTDGLWRYVAAVAAVILIGAIWGAFAVPDDPSRSGNATVPVPGALRLFLEFAILFGGAWALHAAGFAWAGPPISLMIIVHYLLWTDRIVWLLQQ